MCVAGPIHNNSIGVFHSPQPLVERRWRIALGHELLSVVRVHSTKESSQDDVARWDVYNGVANCHRHAFMYPRNIYDIPRCAERRDILFHIVGEVKKAHGDCPFVVGRGKVKVSHCDWQFSGACAASPDGETFENEVAFVLLVHAQKQ